MGRAYRDQRPEVDARALGANCDACPLNGTCNPVPPETHFDPELIVLAEFPGSTGVDKGRPLAGETGHLFDKMLEALRIPRDGLHITSAILCKPIYGMTPKEWTDAVNACRPRLIQELAELPEKIPILAYGGRALQAVTGYVKIFDHLGVPQATTKIHPARQVLPALHPSFVLPHRSPQYKQAVEIHTNRAWKLARGKMAKWNWPSTITDSAGDAEVIAALRKLHAAKVLGVDTETPNIDKKDPTRFPQIAKQLLNIGVASKELGLAVCITWPIASEPVRQAMLDLLATDIPKVMQNCTFDMMVFYYNGIVIGGRVLDTMIAWNFIGQRQNAKLSYQACIFTTAERWKEAFHEGSKRSIKPGEDFFAGADAQDRAIYCARDAYLTVWLWIFYDKWYFTEGDQEGDRLRRLFDARMENIRCALYSRQRGVHVDQKARDRHMRPTRIRRNWALRKLRRKVSALGFEWIREESKTVWGERIDVKKDGTEKRVRVNMGKVVERSSHPFNPNNIRHIRKLFKILGIQGGRPKRDGGEESFDAKVLEGLSAQLARHFDPRVRTLASEILEYRKHQKVLSTNLVGLPIYSDGRIHPNWKMGNTISMRDASSDPNGQNIQKILRDMFTPHLNAEDAAAWEFMWLVSADFSQLELMIVALVSGDPILLDAFAKGIDVHAANAELIFGDVFRYANKEDREALRKFAKIFVYAVMYGGKPQKIWEQIVIHFPRMKVLDVVRAYDTFVAAHPWIINWQRKVIMDAARLGYVEEPVSKHRIYFPGGVEPNAALNAIPQILNAWVMKLAVPKVWERLDRAAGEGVLFYIHDDITIACKDPEAGIAILRECMEQDLEYEGRTVKFKVDVSVSRVNQRDKIEVKRDGSLKVPPGVAGWREINKAGLLDTDEELRKRYE